MTLNKRLRAKKRTMIFMCVYYTLMAVVAILLQTGIFADLLSVFGNGKAYSAVIGTLYAALVPTLSFYLALHAPLGFLGWAKKTFLAAGVVSTVLAAIPFFYICSFYSDILSASSESIDDSVMMPITLIVGLLGLILTYVALYFHPSAEFLSQKGGTVFARITRSVLGFKEKHENVFLIIATILFTALLLLVVVGLIFVIGIALVFFLLNVISRLLTRSGSEHPDYEVSDGGYTHTLTYREYDRVHSCDRYQDQYGNYWVTSDNGKTFSREK